MYILLYLMVLLSIAFFTLLERKILGYMQVRKGPNKVLLVGVFQPILDGVKLFMKENTINFNVNKILFSFFPFFSFLLMLIMWQLYFFNKMDFFLNSFLFFLLISGLSVYAIMGSGWVSNSKYSLLGCYRSAAQVISYEVGFIFLVMILCFFINNYSIMSIVNKNMYGHMIIFGVFWLFIIWFVIILAELNRAPFDFAEGESELVSGFNVEYGGLKFAFLFLSEYGMMILMCYLTSFIFMSFSLVLCLFIMFMMVWVRGVFPRYRYDNLMYLNWKCFLPVILLSVIIIYMIKLFM